jgi:hypothetical protein
MVFLTPTRGKAMVHRVLVLAQLGQDTTFNQLTVNIQVAP